MPELTPEERARYSRHLVLEEVGWTGQEALKRARVAVVGTGGLGSPVSLYLAAAGVGTIGLIDFDAVDITNLQRQVLFGSADVGRLKVVAAAERLEQLNPHVTTVQHAVHLNSDNALDVLRPYDVVVDGSDNFPTRYLVNDACVLLGKPYVYGSILRFEGQLSVFDARSGPCYRCLFREPPPPGLVPGCAESGVLGVLPGIIGSVQALETIKLILGRGDTLAGRIQVFDALSFRWRELRLKKNPDCPVCGEHPTITSLIDYDAFCGLISPLPTGPDSDHVPQLSPGELKQRLDAGDRLNLLDVRDPLEWSRGNLERYGARLVPLGEVQQRAREFDPQAEYVLYCLSGIRSATAVRWLRSQGFARVWNLAGGIKQWVADIEPDARA